MRAYLAFEPRDLWLGVYWSRRPNGLHVYVCFIPCFPLHIVFFSKRSPVPPTKEYPHTGMPCEGWCAVTEHKQAEGHPQDFKIQAGD